MLSKIKVSKVWNFSGNCGKSKGIRLKTPLIRLNKPSIINYHNPKKMNYKTYAMY